MAGVFEIANKINEIEVGAWRLLLSEPHRVMFFCGAVQGVAAMAWWLADLLGRYFGLYAPLTRSIVPGWGHAWLLLYGYFPFFIFGFLMTAMPNWLAVSKPERSWYAPSALLLALGIVTFYAGLATSNTVVATGVVLHAAGWVWGWAALAEGLLAARSPSRGYAALVLVLLLAGLLGDVFFAVAVTGGGYGYAAVALYNAVWWFLLPLFLTVSTRMVPFFASRVLGDAVYYRPAWGRPLLITLSIAHGTLGVVGWHGWVWLVDLPFAAAVLWLAWRWGITGAMKVRLLAVLHVSLAVLAGALLVSAGLSLALLNGYIANVGLAPLHLTTIGYCAAMTLGMSSRVSLGHSGRALAADALTWRCYLGLLGVASLRVIAESAQGSEAVRYLLVAAALLWLLSMGIWASRYAPMYVRQRVDAH